MKHINIIFTRDSGDILFQATMHIHSIGDRRMKCIALVVLSDDKYYDANGLMNSLLARFSHWVFIAAMNVIKSTLTTKKVGVMMKLIEV